MELTIIEKLVLKEEVTESDILVELFEICDRVHSSCHEGCPVYSRMTEEERDSCECHCHKRPIEMIQFIIARSK